MVLVTGGRRDLPCSLVLYLEESLLFPGARLQAILSEKRAFPHLFAQILAQASTKVEETLICLGHHC